MSSERLQGSQNPEDARQLCRFDAEVGVMIESRTCGVAAFLEAFVVATGPSPSPAPSWARVRTTLVHRPGINLRDAFTCGEAVARRADTAGLGPASAKQRRVATRAMLAN